jgi:hypothetical protein
LHLVKQKDMPKEKWVQIQDFQNEHKDAFIVVADPRSDSVSISFGGLNAFLKFPSGPMDKGVIFNALRKSKFEEAVVPFISGLMEATGMKGNDVPTANLMRSIGGAVKSIGEEREIIKTNQLKSNVKTNRNKK